ncbi:MAG: SAM-dependent methyltransferase [Sphingomonas sp. 32-66-10]|nr:MAG: SAM-dependent methyltransferase [Sphingomonas sp. 32-66-10]
MVGARVTQSSTRNRGRRDGATHRDAIGAAVARVAEPWLHRLLDRIDAGLAEGAIAATLPGGIQRRLGGRAPGPEAVVVIRSWRALWRLATGGSAGWYEAWAAGEWTSPDPVPLFDLFVRNRATLGNTGRAGGVGRIVKRVWHWLQRNSRTGSRRNIAYHYDLGNDFYAPWLDASMTYSSALFAPGVTSLAEGQAAKLAAVLERTGTVPGDRILEIGCGWGSFAELAARGGRQMHGITAGLQGATVGLTDYRDVSGTFDAVASIEMVEAVGQDYWPAYLETIARALKPGGRAAIQYIAIDDAIFDAYARNVDFIQAYVFPGGMLLSESRFRAIAEAQGLRWTDQLNFGADYAETLKQWREAFDAAVAEGRLPGEFDSHFIDLWRYYLMYCEGGFRGGGIHVAQVTLIKN